MKFRVSHKTGSEVVEAETPEAAKKAFYELKGVKRLVGVHRRDDRSRLGTAWGDDHPCATCGWTASAHDGSCRSKRGLGPVVVPQEEEP